MVADQNFLDRSKRELGIDPTCSENRDLKASCGVYVVDIHILIRGNTYRECVVERRYKGCSLGVWDGL